MQCPVLYIQIDSVASIKSIADLYTVIDVKGKSGIFTVSRRIFFVDSRNPGYFKDNYEIKINFINPSVTKVSSFKGAGTIPRDFFLFLELLNCVFGAYYEICCPLSESCIFPSKNSAFAEQ